MQISAKFLIETYSRPALCWYGSFRDVRLSIWLTHWNMNCEPSADDVELSKGDSFNLVSVVYYSAACCDASFDSYHNYAE